ncbi:hypothetical protein niasHS_007924 [Heterodera schachtii]|uniref:Uncharacterized protein n=1 Tax=Heterodera schachtii TaxID=97005 RepID=A0ABD2JQ08_HETSC
MDNLTVVNPTVDIPTMDNWHWGHSDNGHWTVVNPTMDNCTLVNPTVDIPTMDNLTVVNPTVDITTMDNWTVVNPTVDITTMDNWTVVNPTVVIPNNWTLVNPTVNPTVELPAVVRPTVRTMDRGGRSDSGQFYS